MRLPSTPEVLKNEGHVNRAVGHAPSYPDRARIDSDVRAFLRPVSTPWIVFDRDSRVDDFAKSALRVGAVFASAPSFRPEVQAPAVMPCPAYAPTTTAVAMFDAVAMGLIDVGPIANMFPPSSGSPASVVEPSNVVVCADVMAESASYAIGALEGQGASTPPEPSLPRPSLTSSPFVTRRHRGRVVVGAFAGIVAIASVSALALGARNVKGAATQSLETPTVVVPTPAEPVPTEAPTLELDAPAASATIESKSAAPPSDVKKRFGKLTIKADAKHKNVWFDGKRMLGSGQRSFLVFCGMHTVAVSDKADAKDVEIPCNGEYTVAK